MQKLQEKANSKAKKITQKLIESFFLKRDDICVGFYDRNIEIVDVDMFLVERISLNVE